MSVDSAASPSELRRLIEQTHSLDGIRVLCVDLGIDYDLLAGEEKSRKTAELVLYCERQGRLPELIERLQQLPRIDHKPDHLAAILYQLAQDTRALREMLEENLRGIGELLTNYETRIRNFLLYYLGTEKEPVPFGGREADFERLERWRGQSERPFLLLAAPASRGKSALLVRWSQALLERPEVAVVFVPVSARVNTNLEEVTFACLASRLAHFYGRPIPTEVSSMTPQLWRGLVADYLREPLPDGRQLLVIVDGLDEAAWEVGADLFPLELPSAVRIVVSARYLAGDAASAEAWLRRLGWDRFALAESLTLATLTEAGVRDVLVKMGCPLDELGEKVDIVAELHRLSEGDPLLVELYVKDLWQKGDAVTRLRPEDLQDIQPGYKHFFDNWWSDQKKLWGDRQPWRDKLVRTLLHYLLPIASGPLQLEDVQALLLPNIDADSVLIRETIQEDLNRFVIGDGDKQGYVLAHPKLGDYFRGTYLSPSGQRQWHRTFVAWGQRDIEKRQAGELGPDEVSRYLLQYYSHHLEAAGVDMEGYRPLLSREWMESWHRFTGTYAGFLRDVDRVCEFAKQEDRAAVERGEVAPHLGVEIRCALYHSSVRSLAGNLTGKLLAQLVEHGIWTAEQGLVYSRQQLDIGTQVESIMLLLPYLPVELRSQVLHQALQATQTIEDEGVRAGVLSSLAPHLPIKVYQVAQAIEDEGVRAGVLSSLAPHLPIKVYQAALAIEDAGPRAWVLSNLAPHLPTDLRSWALHQAFQIAKTIEEERHRATVLRTLAPYMPTKVYQVAQTIEDAGAYAWVLSNLALHLPTDLQSLVWKQTLQAVQSIENEWERVRRLCSLAPYLPSEVYHAFQNTEDQWVRVQLLTSLAPYLPSEAYHAAKAWDVWDQTEVLSSLAPYLPFEVYQAAQGLHVWARAELLGALAPHMPAELQPSVLRQALQAAQTISDERVRAEVLSSLVPYLPKAFWPQALEQARRIIAALPESGRAKLLIALAPYFSTEVYHEVQAFEDEPSRVEMLIGLAPYLPSEVYQTAQTIRDKSSHVRVLSSLAPYLPSEVYQAAQDLNEWHRAEVLSSLAPYLPSEVYWAAQAIEDEGRRVEVLICLAPHLPTEVYRVARTIRNERHRAEVLGNLVPHLPGELQSSALRPALQAAQAISDEIGRAWELLSLALHLPTELRPQILQRILQVGRPIVSDESRARILGSLAPYLPSEVYQAAQDLDERHRAEVLSNLAPYLPVEVNQAIQVFREEDDRIKVLSSLVPHLPVDLQASALRKALQATQVMRGYEARIEVLGRLQDQLVALPKGQSYDMWSSCLSGLGGRERWKLFVYLAHSAKLIEKLGGDWALKETLAAVEDVGAWWP